MRLVKNLIIFIVTAIIGLAIFMPKLNLYNYLEHKLNEKGLVIYNEKSRNKLTNLYITDAKVSYQGADIAEINSITITPLILFNQIVAKNIELTGVAKQFLNVEIESLKITQSIIKPYIVKISANGTFGVASGYANLKQKIIHIDIVDAQDIEPIKKLLKRGEKGWYYESQF